MGLGDLKGCAAGDLGREVRSVGFGVLWGCEVPLGQEVWGWKASARLCGVVGPRGWGCGIGAKGMGCWGLKAGVVGWEGAVGAVGLGCTHGMERVGGRLWDRGRPSSVGWSPVGCRYGLGGRGEGDGNRGWSCLWGRGHEEEGLGAEPLGSAARGWEVRLQRGAEARCWHPWGAQLGAAGGCRLV